MDDRDFGFGTASRRDFIASLAAIGATSLVPSFAGSAEAATTIQRIDMHHHFLPQHYMAEEHERSPVTHGVPPSFLMQWTAQQSIDALDKAGVQFAVASISTPGVWYGDVALGRSLSREWNEAAAQSVRDHPTRFGFFAPVPLPDTDGSLAEIEYALGSLKADGINFLSNYEGKWLGDPAFEPVIAELNRRKSVVYVHPTFSPCCTNNMVPRLVAQILEFPYDTTRTIVSLVTSGTTTRYPDIRWIFSHGGGALTGIYGRIEGLGNAPALKEKFPAGMHAELRKLYYDTASLNHISSLPALLKLVPSSQVLLGSDYPLAGAPPTDVMIKKAVEEFEASKPSARLRRAVERDNAIRLIPRIANI